MTRTDVPPADDTIRPAGPGDTAVRYATVPVVSVVPTASEIPTQSPVPVTAGGTGVVGDERCGRWVPTKKEQLRLLLGKQVAPDDTRTVYALARDLAPLVGLHPGTARRYLPGLLAERGHLPGKKPGPAERTRHADQR
jgi:hypothetical protein